MYVNMNYALISVEECDVCQEMNCFLSEGQWIIILYFIYTQTNVRIFILLSQRFGYCVLQPLSGICRLEKSILYICDFIHCYMKVVLEKLVKFSLVTKSSAFGIL